MAVGSERRGSKHLLSDVVVVVQTNGRHTHIQTQERENKPAKVAFFRLLIKVERQSSARIFFFCLRSLKRQLKPSVAFFSLSLKQQLENALVLRARATRLVGGHLLLCSFKHSTFSHSSSSLFCFKLILFFSLIALASFLPFGQHSNSASTFLPNLFLSLSLKLSHFNTFIQLKLFLKNAKLKTQKLFKLHKNRRKVQKKRSTLKLAKKNKQKSIQNLQAKTREKSIFHKSFIWQRKKAPQVAKSERKKALLQPIRIRNKHTYRKK